MFFQAYLFGVLCFGKSMVLSKKSQDCSALSPFGFGGSGPNQREGPGLKHADFLFFFLGETLVLFLGLNHGVSWRILFYPCWLPWLTSSICRPRSLRTGTQRKLVSKTCNWAHREASGKRRTFSSVHYVLNNYSWRGRQSPGTRMTQRSLQIWSPNTMGSRRMLQSKSGRYHLMPIRPSMASSWGWQANQEHWSDPIWITTSGKNQVVWFFFRHQFHFALGFPKVDFQLGWFQYITWTSLWGYNESILRLKRHQLNETAKGCAPFWQQLLTVPWL